MDPSGGNEQRIAAIAALDQPLRRDLYRLLGDGCWRTRDDAAGTLGMPRSVAAFHLDKLADAGVLEVRFERPTGRRGPGAGRPAKLYRLAVGELAASVPDRRYDLAGSLLVSAVATSTRTGDPVGECLRDAALTTGRAIGSTVRDAGAAVRPAAGRRDAIVELLARHGYEPQVGRGEIVLANCPFHRLAEQERELVCGMNLDLLTGLLESADPHGDLTARLQPEGGYCCVRIAVT